MYILDPLDEASLRRLNVARLRSKRNREGVHLYFEVAPGITLVIVYLRCSSKEQKDRSASLEDQLRDVADKLREEGCLIAAVFWDDESGTHYDRPGLQEARNFAKLHVAQGLAVWATNRFGRNMIDGLLVARELSENGCPVWHRRNASSRYRIANTRDAEDLSDLTDGLLDAQSDYDEHNSKIQRGQRGILKQGAWPFGRFPASLLYETQEEGSRANRIQRVVLRPEARATLHACFDFLKQESSRETLQALAETFGVRMQLLLRDLQSPRLRGVLDTPKLQMEDNHHPRLELLSQPGFDFLQAYLGSAAPEVLAPTNAPYKDLLPSTSAEELYFVSEGQIGRICSECGLVAAPAPDSGLAYLDRNFWVCPNGHRVRAVPDHVYHGLAFGNKSPCPTCGRHEYWVRKGRVAFDGREWLRMQCRKCHTEILCTHELDALLKRMLRKNKRVMGPYGALRMGGQRLLEFYGRVTRSSG